MKEQVTFSRFYEAFKASRPNNFTYDGLKALFDYLEEYEESTGEELEFDVIALCCTYSEYEDLEEFQQNYGSDYESIEDIEDRTTVIPVNGDSFIVQDF